MRVRIAWLQMSMVTADIMSTARWYSCTRQALAVTVDRIVHVLRTVGRLAIRNGDGIDVWLA